MYFIEHAFCETGVWRKVKSNLRLPFIIGRKGSGKSAIALKLQIDSAAIADGNFIKFVPDDFRHVEVRTLLQCLVNSNTSWQYIYQKVWEGIILGQIVNHILNGDKSERYYKVSSEFKEEVQKFEKECSFYVNALEDALARVITDFVKDKAFQQDEIELVKLREMLEPYNWKNLTRVIDSEYKKDSEHLGKIILTIDGLDEYWDCSEPSLHFLAQLLRVVKTLSAKMENSVKFVICLRDNIFRALVDTKCVEYDKLESAINYLDWDSKTLFELVATRAFVGNSTKDAVKSLRSILPEYIQELDIESYLGRYILNRPRAYINYFQLLQTECHGSEIVEEAHVKKSINQYRANRLTDLENEFGLTYPGITKLIDELQSMPEEFGQKEILERLDLLCSNADLQNKVPDLNGTSLSANYLISRG